MFLQSFGRAFTFVPEMLFSWYLWTSLYCVLQFAAIGWFTRRRAIRSKPLPRAASDATWYLPVYIWGIESEVDVLNLGALDGFPNTLALEQPMMLLVTLSLCLAAESWARRRGWVSRAEHASLPLPVVAAIVSVEMLWTVLMTPPFNTQGVSNDADGPAALVVATLPTGAASCVRPPTEPWPSILANAGQHPLSKHRSLRAIRLPAGLVNATIITVVPTEAGATLNVCDLKDRRGSGCTSSSRSIDQEDFDELARLARTGLWGKVAWAPTGKPEVFDGVSWRIEGYRDGGSWAIVRHEPIDPDVVVLLNEIIFLARRPDLRVRSFAVTLTGVPVLPAASTTQAKNDRAGAVAACAAHFLKSAPYRCIAVASFQEGPCDGGRCLTANPPPDQVLAALRKRFEGLRSATDPTCSARSDGETLWIRTPNSGDGWPSPHVAIWPAGRVPGFHAATGCEARRRLFGGWKVKLHDPID